MLDCAQTAALLQGWDKILVMSHASPDGDTLGSAAGGFSLRRPGAGEILLSVCGAAPGRL